MEQKVISFNAANQKGLTLLFFPLWLAIPGGIIISVGSSLILLLAPIFYHEAEWFLLLIVLVAYWLLIGKDSYKYFSKFFVPPEVVVTNTVNYRAPNRLKRKIGTVKMLRKGKKQSATPMEDLIDLAEITWFNLRGYNFGAFLNELPDGSRELVWVFALKGISYSLTNAEYAAISESIQLGLRDFSRIAGPECMTLYGSVMADCTEQEIKMAALIAGAKTPEDRFIQTQRLKRIKRLTQLGRHCPQNLIVCCTTKLDLASAQLNQSSPLEVIIQRLENLLKREDAAANLNRNLEVMLLDSFERGFLPYLDFLTDRMKFAVEPLTAQGCWQWAWERVNTGPAPSVNSMLILTEKGLEVRRRKGPSLASLLFRAGDPSLKNDHVGLPGKNQLVGGMVMDKPPKREWLSDHISELLMFGSEALMHPKTVNVEVICQFTAVPRFQANLKAQVRTRQSNSFRLFNKENDRTDVGSDEIYKDSVRAERDLVRGEEQVRAAYMVLLYRKSERTLAQAIRQFSTLPPFSGQILSREASYFAQLWLDSLPFNRHRILAGGGFSFNRFERRFTDNSQPMVSLLPMAKEMELYPNGFEFITPTRAPLYFDPLGAEPHNHCLINGFTGAGKTAVLQALADYAKAQSAKIMIVDGTKGDGAGSYRDWVKFHNGAYFNPVEDASNPFEGFDFRLHEPDSEEFKFRLTTFTNFLTEAMTDLSYVGDSPSRLSKTLNIHTFCVDAFLADPDIQARRDRAFDGGMGSEAWDDFPTMRDYLNFLVVENLRSSARTTEYLDCLDEAKTELEALMLRPEGRAISRPSTFDSDADLLVYGIGNFSSDAKTKPYILAAQANVLAQALKPGKIYCIFEEISISITCRPVAAFIADAWARGRKMDLWCVGVGQGVGPIEKSIAADSVFVNTRTYITGFITTDSIPALGRRNIPEELLMQCTRESFFRPKKEYARRYLISQSNTHVFGDYFADFVSMAQIGNTGPENELREQYLAQYPNKYEAYLKLAAHLEKDSIDHA